MQKIRPGYKQTEIGVIPWDWEVKPLGLLVQINSGESPSRFRFVLDGVPYFKVEQLNNSQKYLNKNSTPYQVLSEKTVPRDSIVFAKRGAAIAQNKIRILAQKSFMDTNVMALTPSGGLFHEYLFYCLTHINLWNFADTTSVPQINNKHINPLNIPVPIIEQQRAIAAALSDADALIASLDALIAKKRDLKQAAMQQLLTGKTRLPGCRGEWKPIKMAESSQLKARIGWQGLTTAEYRDNGEYYLVTGTDFADGRINWANCCFVDRIRYVQDRNIQLHEEDVLLTKDGTIGKVGYVDMLPGPATLNSGVFVIRPRDKCYSPLFLYYILTSRIFDEFLSKLQAGSTISHLYQKDFVSFEFQAPPIDEQIAIAAVLADMDAELIVIFDKRDKARAVKQGMMQELLTGRIRLT